MRSKFAKLTLTAALALATTLALSCSSDDSSDNNNSGGDPSSPSGGNVESVTIGTQVWMKKNLDVAGGKCYGEGLQERSEEIILPNGQYGYEFKDLTEEEVQANCTKYGKLYDWETAKNACPAGWHLPSNLEWDTLLGFVDGTSPNKGESQTAGKDLKASSGWNNNGNGSGNGTDKHNFSALPGGLGTDTYVTRVGVRAVWWTSSEYDDEAALRGMRNDQDRVFAEVYEKSFLASIRCIKD